MLKRKVQLPPDHMYPVDDWKMVEKQFNEEFLAQAETIFATSNGYMGMRGNFDEGRPVFQPGTFVNGFHESWPITYGEEAFGFAKTGQTMVNVPEAKIIKLYVDDEPLYLPTANILKYERTLDMKRGTLDRSLLWETPSGKIVSIKSSRVVSFKHRHLAAISFEVEVTNASSPVVISSEIINTPVSSLSDEDPRRARRMSDRVLMPELSYKKDLRILLGYSTNNSKMSLACGIEHTFETACQYTVTSDCTNNSGEAVFSINAEPNMPIRLVKFITFHTSRSAPTGELCTRGERTLKHGMKEGFNALVKGQREYLDDFWKRSDIKISGGHERTQQLIRFNLFQIIQAAGRAEGTGVGARGLTGQAYDGHYFWDTETYVLPFLIYTSPRIARNLLSFRYSHLEKARKRAREVNQRGALFPWRTINGEEASAYFAAGTAQYHINADIMYALQKYVEVTGDEEFLFNHGAEMLVETARLWLDLGCYPDGTEGQFHIHGVTGPDEYNAIVDNNMYTNMMARQNLIYAAATVINLRDKNPELYKSLVHKTGLKVGEIEEWKLAAKNMYTPYDRENKIDAQDDNFLSREIWDFKNTPPEKYPLLLHFHPLVIYRSRVIKQADVLLAMFLLGSEFSLEQKKRNFDYYDPLTTGDSSLSASVESIIAFEIGYTEKANEYLNYALLMDLANIGGNVQDGAHIASMGGTWLSFVYGMAGMRDYNGKLSFTPNIRGGDQEITFPVTYRGQLLQVKISQGEAVYTLLEGYEIRFHHREFPVLLKLGEKASFKL